MLPREAGVEREAASWFSQIYPRTLAPDWHLAKPLNIIQVCHRYQIVLRRLM